MKWSMASSLSRNFKTRQREIRCWNRVQRGKTVYLYWKELNGATNPHMISALPLKSGWTTLHIGCLQHFISSPSTGSILWHPEKWNFRKSCSKRNNRSQYALNFPSPSLQCWILTARITGPIYHFDVKEEASHVSQPNGFKRAFFFPDFSYSYSDMSCSDIPREGTWKRLLIFYAVHNLQQKRLCKLQGELHRPSVRMWKGEKSVETLVCTSLFAGFMDI